MKYKILAVKWRSALHTVGFVAYATENPVRPGEWNSVVGYVPDQLNIAIPADDLSGESFTTSVANGGVSETADLQYIAANGAKIEWQIAEVLFPNLDIKLHKYYEKQN